MALSVLNPRLCVPSLGAELSNGPDSVLGVMMSQKSQDVTPTF